MSDTNILKFEKPFKPINSTITFEKYLEFRKDLSDLFKFYELRPPAWDIKDLTGNEDSIHCTMSFIFEDCTITNTPPSSKFNLDKDFWGETSGLAEKILNLRILE
jgi:hypothetical protein